MHNSIPRTISLVVGKDIGLYSRIKSSKVAQGIKHVSKVNTYTYVYSHGRNMESHNYVWHRYMYNVMYIHEHEH